MAEHRILKVDRNVDGQTVGASIEIELPECLNEAVLELTEERILGLVQGDILEAVRRNIYKALGAKKAWKMTEAQIQDFYSDPENLLLNPVQVARDSAKRERLQASLDKTRAREASLAAQLNEGGGTAETAEED